ncbi:hypothetical protein C8Q73DRAFT_704112 [Cubamyces lactineus]|nr:hypothetical protein C8Q73DRAFT_704112 [Cubamyces lactineus]
MYCGCLHLSSTSSISSSVRDTSSRAQQHHPGSQKNANASSRTCKSLSSIQSNALRLLVFCLKRYGRRAFYVSRRSLALVAPSRFRRPLGQSHAAFPTFKADATGAATFLGEADPYFRVLGLVSFVLPVSLGNSGLPTSSGQLNGLAYQVARVVHTFEHSDFCRGQATVRLFRDSYLDSSFKLKACNLLLDLVRRPRTSARGSAATFRATIAIFITALPLFNWCLPPDRGTPSMQSTWTATLLSRLQRLSATEHCPNSLAVVSYFHELR